MLKPWVPLNSSQSASWEQHTCRRLKLVRGPLLLVTFHRVRIVLDVLEAGEEHRVEGRGGDLGDTAAEVLLEDAVGDDLPLGEAVALGPLPTRSLRLKVCPGSSTVPLISRQLARG